MAPEPTTEIVAKTPGWEALVEWVDAWKDPAIEQEKWDALPLEKRRWKALKALAAHPLVRCNAVSAKAWLKRHGRPSGLRLVGVSRVIGCEPEDWETPTELSQRRAAERKAGSS